MPAKAKFRIIIKPNGDAVVRPPSDTCEKGAGKTVWFRNLTAGKVHISVPGGVFDKNPPNNVADPAAVYILEPKDAPSNGDTLELPVLNSPTVGGVFTFKVFCEETFSFAQGNSDPEFIIEN
jgi:hypothetical protein